MKGRDVAKNCGIGLIILLAGVSIASVRAQERAGNKNAPRVDALGDPLPENAVARFGTLRFHHPESVYELELSPDDRFVATMGGRLIMWDARTGKQLWTADGPQGGGNGVSYGKRRFVFTPDSKQIYLAKDLSTIDVFDARTGNRNVLNLAGLRRLTPRTDTSAFLSIDIDSSARFLALGSEKSVIVCDINGETLFEIANNADKPITPAEMNQDRLFFNGHYSFGRFSPDGAMLAVATSDRAKELRLFNAQTGELLRTVELSARPVQFAFSKDGMHLAVSERDHSVRLYECDTAKRVWHHPIALNNPYENYTSSITYSTDGLFIAAGATDNRIYVVDALTGAGRGVLSGHHWYPWGLAFSSDSRTLYSSGWEGRIRRWDVPSLKQLPLPNGIAGSSVIAIAPSGDVIAYVDDSGTVHLVDRATGRKLRQLPGEGAGFSQLRFSPDSRRLAGGGSQGKEVVVRVWNLIDGALERQWHWLKGKDPHSSVEDLCFRPDGKRLASAVFRQSMVQIWNLETGERLPDVKHSQVYGLSYSPDGKTLATVGWDSNVRFWDGETLAPDDAIDVKTMAGDNDSRMYTVRFDPTGRLLATLQLQGTVRIWDAATRKPIRQFQADGRPHYGAMAFSPDGKQLAVGLAGGAITIWDPETGALLNNSCRHANTVSTLEFGGDSKTLVSGGSDGVGYLWDIPLPADAK